MNSSIRIYISLISLILVIAYSFYFHLVFGISMALLILFYTGYKKTEIVDYLLIGSEILFTNQEVYLKQQTEIRIKEELLFIVLTAIIFGILVYLSIIVWNLMMFGLGLFIINNIIFHLGEFYHVCFYRFKNLSWDSKIYE